jgi:hypothetical protein
MALFGDHEEDAGAAPANASTGAKGDTDAAPGSPADAKKKQHRDNMVIIAVGIAGLIVTFLFYRSNKAAQAAATTASSSTLPVTSGSVVGSGGAGGDPYADQMVGQLQAQEQANGQATAGLGQLLQTLTAEVSTLQPGQGTPSGTTPAAAPSALPWIGPQSMPNVVQAFNSTNSGQFEQIGSENNGVYSGEEVAGGIPLFAGGGTAFFQNFGLPGGPSPSYTGPVYAPTADQPYVGYTGAISGAPAGNTTGR